MIYLCITPDRDEKTRMIMMALHAGIGSAGRVVRGAPPADGAPFAVWGQEWLTLEIVPPALAAGRPFWTIDNGYWNPGRGTRRGYYRFCYRSMSPVYLPDSPFLRRPSAVQLKPWREDGKHVLLAMPGPHFGAAIGVDVPGWCRGIVRDVHDRCRKIGREFRVRVRDEVTRPLRDDLEGAWCVVTHSSNVAVDAVVAGVPVFVQPTSAAAPVGRLDLELDRPVRPGRNRWLSSLASQHFTLNEMRSGEAWKWMRRIADYVDGNSGTENRAA